MKKRRFLHRPTLNNINTQRLSRRLKKAPIKPLLLMITSVGTGVAIGYFAGKRKYY